MRAKADARRTYIPLQRRAPSPWSNGAYSARSRLFEMRLSHILRALAIAPAVALAACSSQATGARQDAAPPAVPVTVAAAVRKAMPLDASVVGTVEAYSTVSVRAQITGELTSGELPAGRRRAGRAGTVHARSPAARRRAAAGAGHARTRHRASRQRQGDHASATSSSSSAASSRASSATTRAPASRRSRPRSPRIARRSRTRRCSCSTRPSARRSRAAPAR